MMQCASCDTRITDDAAKTGICPKCGLPLAGIGGTMRFSPSLFAHLPTADLESPPATPEIPPAIVATLAGETAAKSSAPGIPPSAESFGVAARAVDSPAPSNTLPLPESTPGTAATHI